jgi:amidase
MDHATPSRVPAVSPDPTRAGVFELVAALQRGQVAARELLDAFLERVERFNEPLNALVTLATDCARLRADEIDAARVRNQPLPALAGIPVTVKDSFETEGLRTTCGAPQLAKHVPSSNADAVQRLEDEGCIVFGKSNTPIYAGDLQTYNVLFGATVNPWDRSRTCGGSSGGAAVAVACRFSAFELGSDIGGSIRTPAHFCGVYGHKPTYGLIPGRGHIPPPPGALSIPDLAVCGPLARSADDLALALKAAKDPQLALRESRRRPGKFRAAVWFDDPDFPLDAVVREVLETAVDALGRAGTRVQRQAPIGRLAELLDDYLRLLWPLSTAHLAPQAIARMVEETSGHPADSWHAKLARYATASHREWLAVHERRERLRSRFVDFFRDWDVLLMPVNPVTAFAHDHSRDLMARTIVVNGEPRWYWEQLAWVSPATMTYLPATAAPVGRSREGLPVGIQIVGPPFGDLTTIEFARQMAEVVGGFIPPPGFE